METLENGAFDPTRGQWDVVALGNPGCDGFPSDNPYHPRCWDYWSPDEEKWFEALDEAIAMVFLKECLRLFCQQPEGFTAQLGRAFDSIEQLQYGKQPRYDEWDAPLYVSWYQARQVHLVCAMLKLYPPPPSRGPLRVVDVGCGAWAVPIALAMLAVRGHRWLGDCQVSIHGIDPSTQMTRIGKKLWREFGCAARVRGLDTSFVDRMTDDDSIFTSVTYSDPLAGDASAKLWLLAIHAVYDQSQREIRRFLAECRHQHRSHLRYELLTTDGEKKQHLKSLVVNVDGSGKWTGPQPIWEGKLRATTGFRRELHKLLEKCRSPITEKHMNYLRNSVRWDPCLNPISQDAVWVRRAGQ